MPDDQLHKMIDAAVGKGQRAQRSALRRLIGMLDFEPQLAPEAVRAVVDEEIADQKQRGLAALATLAASARESLASTAAQAVRAALSDPEGAFPREALVGVRPAAPDAVAAVIDGVVARYDLFGKRLGWLLSPTRADDVQKLDPVRDADQIYHYLSYEFRAEQKVYGILFELRSGSGLPSASLVLQGTGEITLRGFRRNTETFMIFSNLFDWGLDSKRGRQMLARLNQFHAPYALHNDAFLFTLGGIMFVPELWNRKLGWRRFTDVERLGWFHAYARMGRAMNIQGITDDYDQMFRLWNDISKAHCATSTLGRKLFDEVVVQMLATYPEEARAPFVSALIAGMDDLFRDTMGLPPPPADVLEDLRAAFRLIGRTQAAMPRAPWIRSLQLHPMYARVDSLGVQGRSARMPAPAVAPPANGGQRQFLRPITAAADVPEVDLPVITLEQLGKHTGDDDAWLAIDGRVYDVTRFLYEHPGGRAVLAKQLGKDATDAFRRVAHTEAAHISMTNFRVARLADPPAAQVPPPPFRERYDRRPSESRAWTRADWDRAIAQLVSFAGRYEEAIQNPDRDPRQFPIVLPNDPRGQAQRADEVVPPPEPARRCPWPANGEAPDEAPEGGPIPR